MAAEPRTAAQLALALLALASLGALAAPALAGSPGSTGQARLDRTVRYLQEAQNGDGGFGGAPGAESDPDFSAWVALGLAAAGINPQDQRRPGGATVYAYLLGHAGELALAGAECASGACTTELERVLLVVDASGTSPHDFGGVDLVAGLLGRQLPDGGFPHEAGSGRPGVNDTIFAILSLSPVAEPAAREAVQRAADWVLAAQNADGSWPASCPRTVAGCAASGQDPPSEIDMTAAAVEGLNAAGRHLTEAQARAFAFLKAAQDPDGGFPELPGEPEANVASTAWAAQAIWSAGEDPEAWRTGAGGASEEPLGYMESLQQPDGHVRWRRSSDLNGVWMTAYVAPAFAGQALPIPAPPLSGQPPEPGPGRSAGVIAGGGGGGAPLFSRPRPQSRGRTPGGARLVGKQTARPRDHSPTRRGANAVQPAGTETAEPRAGGAEPRRVATGTGRSGNGGSSESDGQEVSGTVIGPAARGAKGQLAFGAPGLHAAGAESEGQLAIGVAGAALLAALAGVWRERRGGEALA